MVQISRWPPGEGQECVEGQRKSIVDSEDTLMMSIAEDSAVRLILESFPIVEQNPRAYRS